MFRFLFYRHVDLYSYGIANANPIYFSPSKWQPGVCAVPPLICAYAPRGPSPTRVHNPGPILIRVSSRSYPMVWCDHVLNGYGHVCILGATSGERGQDEKKRKWRARVEWLVYSIPLLAMTRRYKRGVIVPFGSNIVIGACHLLHTTSPTWYCIFARQQTGPPLYTSPSR